jgi:hypothetical protein
MDFPPAIEQRGIVKRVVETTVTIIVSRVYTYYAVSLSGC